MLPDPVPRLPGELVENATVLADRDALLPLLPRGGVVVEVGVGLGDFSAKLIEACRPAEFIAIDTFRLHELPLFWGRPPSDIFGDRTHGAWYRDRFGSASVRILEGPSHAQMLQLSDEAADVIYIDADHTRPGVAADLAVAARKIKPDGWLVINDYILVDQLGATEPYGVIYATNEFMLEHRWAMQYLTLHSHMYCDVVLRRADLVASARSLRSENDRLRDEVDALRRSTSWRLTAPLRALRRRL